MLLSTLFHQPYSLRKLLRLQVWVCVLPALAVGASLAYTNLRLMQEGVRQQGHLLGRSIVADLERNLAGIESGLRILASAPELQTGDLANFHARARNALPHGIVYNYILTDSQGRQRLNTLRPYGSPLPTGGTPAQLARVFRDRATVLTDVFTGPVTRKPAIAMGVPVEVEGGVAYSLNIGLDPAHVGALLARAAIPPDWVVAVLDANGHIVARSREAERFVGLRAMPDLLRAIGEAPQGHMETVTRDGQEVLTSFATSPNWHWRVVVATPRATIYGEVGSQLTRVLVGLLLAAMLGLWLARTISARVLQAVDGLARSAVAMRNGDDMPAPAIRLAETEVVADALAQAARAMRTVLFHARHDPLTELPNRRHFEDCVQRALARSDRQGEHCAILAVDLDGFKAVNDQFGHAAGDTVLKAVAARLRATIRPYDVACRLGGDEFAVLLAGVDVEQAIDTAGRIVEALSQPYPVDARVSASVGIAVYPLHGQDLAALLARADQAMYRAKSGGKWQAVLA